MKICVYATPILDAMCQLSSNADSRLGCSPFNQPQSVSRELSAQLCSVMSGAVCQSDLYTIISSVICQLRLEYFSLLQHADCLLGCDLSAQLQLVSSAALNCLEPLPGLSSILPPKLWAVSLVAINQSRVHAVTVHCIHSMTVSQLK